MKGEVISKEFQKMVWVQDKDGKEYACYIDDLKQIKKKEDLSEEEKAKCMIAGNIQFRHLMPLSGSGIVFFPKCTYAPEKG